MSKYQIQCVKCQHVISDFKEWFSVQQECPKCGSKHAEVRYDTDYSSLKDRLKEGTDSLWHYFDFLPLEDKNNIISCKEGGIPIEQWDYLEKYAKEHYNIDCKVVVYRNDLNGGTNSFKDVAGSLLASLLKENGISEYVIASTGNTATAYSKYLSLAGIKLTVFVPNCVVEDSVQEITKLGQEVKVVDGDYTFAKQMAANFHKENGVLISAGNIDPVRVEAKKTMVFEFLRQMGKMPEVYIQAVSGGTGPIAIDKGVREIEKFYPEAVLPKIVLVQQDTCDPMVQAWENAEKAGFPEGYQNEYPVIENPQTEITILSTGNPGMFPIVAPIVKKSGGTFVRVLENDIVKLGVEVYQEKNILFGPAGVVCLAGFYEALKKNQIKNGDTVLINVGEGAARNIQFAEKVKNC